MSFGHMRNDLCSLATSRTTLWVHYKVRASAWRSACAHLMFMNTPNPPRSGTNGRNPSLGGFMHMHTAP